MGQDSIYLQVVSNDVHESQHKNAGRVLNLLNKGKHWVLVTLLLSNVIVNESLPVVLDRTLGGGIAAIVGSTVLIGMRSTPSPLSSETMLTCRQSFLEKLCHNLSASDMAFPLVDTCRSLSSPSCISPARYHGPPRSFLTGF